MNRTVAVGWWLDSGLFCYSLLETMVVSPLLVKKTHRERKHGRVSSGILLYFGVELFKVVGKVFVVSVGALLARTWWLWCGKFVPECRSWWWLYAKMIGGVGGCKCFL